MNLLSKSIIKKIAIMLLVCKNIPTQTYIKLSPTPHINYKKPDEREQTISSINQTLQKIAPFRKGQDCQYYVVEKSYKNLLPLITKKEKECLPIGTVLQRGLSCDLELIKEIPTHELQQYLMKHKQPILYEIKKFFL